MADESPTKYTTSDFTAADRWWTPQYARRMSIAMVIAGVVAGSILGPVSLLLGQFWASLGGGSLSYPTWMYGQFAALFALFGVLIGSGGSVATVLLRGRPTTRWALFVRMAVGPMVAGALLFIPSLLGGWGGILTMLIVTALGCVVFVVAGIVSGCARLDSDRSGSTLGAGASALASRP